jgi:hypothetical protein
VRLLTEYFSFLEVSQNFICYAKGPGRDGRFVPESSGQLGDNISCHAKLTSSNRTRHLASLHAGITAKRFAGPRVC